jgi:preprotein translocase subunit SecE
VNGFFQELFHVGIYKRSQGRITRQVTLAALALAVALGFWRFSQVLNDWQQWDKVIGQAIATVLTLACWWMSYRLINVPRFADFLIAVEAEMNKVSWPTRGELFRASVVVLVTIFALAVVLFGFDFVWNWFFRDVARIL